MADLTSWIASAATMIAAMMTAANLGTRVTGWGFVVFTIGSITWAVVGVITGQMSLAITNGFLLLVNVFGIWRWLGREARIEHGSTLASRRSRRLGHVPTLFSASNIIGSDLVDPEGRKLGKVVDIMMDCDSNRLSYAVISHGGIGGAGEVLRAVAEKHLCTADDKVTCDLTTQQFRGLPALQHDAWPVVAPQGAE